MPQTTMNYQFPAMPYLEWEETKNTLHLFFQVVGKIRLRYHPPLNHWWHVPLYLSPKGVTTGRIPYQGQEFELAFDLIAHQLIITTSENKMRSISLQGTSIANFYQNVMTTMASLELPVSILARPYMHPASEIPFAEDTQVRAYDSESVTRYWRVLAQAAGIFEEFRGRFYGKSTPVHVFWHSFDLALTRFSGRQAPVVSGQGTVEKEAYSHEVISFGFWPGDPLFPEPAFYAYAAPLPAGMTDEPLAPTIGYWGKYRGGDMALMRYEEFRKLSDPKQGLLDFLESAYQAAAKSAKWPVNDFLRVQ